MEKVLDSLMQDLDKNNQPVKEKPITSKLFDSLEQPSIPETQFTGNTGAFESKYDEYLNLRNVDPKTLQDLRGEHQPGLEKLGAGLVNSVSELTLGTLKNASYLFDLPQYANIIKGTEDEYSNWFADKLQQAQDNLKVPVYRTQESIGFHPLDAGWWGDNMPSIFSTLSLAIPTTFAVKGLGAAGKLLGGNKILKILKWGEGEAAALEGVTGAFVSRHMESVMEAAGTMESTYNEALEKLKEQNPNANIADLEIQAKAIAGHAAADNYKLNWLALVQDIPQYLLMFGAFGKAKKLAAIQKGEAPSMSTGSRFKDLLKVGIFEGVEEGYQFNTDKYSQNKALSDKGLTTPKSFSQTVLDNVADGEFLSSMFLGAIGGAGSQAIMGYKLQKAEEQKNKFYNNLLQANKDVIIDDADGFMRTKDNAFLSAAMDHVQNGTLDKFRSGIEALKNSKKEFLDNSTTFDSKDFQQTIEQRLQDLDFVEETAAKVNNKLDLSPALKHVELGNRLSQRLLERGLSKINSEITKEIATESIERNLTGTEALLKKDLIELAALKGLNDPRFKNQIKDLEEKVKLQTTSMIEDNDIYPNVKSEADIMKQLSTSGDDALMNKIKHNVLLKKELLDVKDNLDKLNTPEGRKEQEEKVQEEIKRLQKEQEAKIKAEEAKKKAEEEAKKNPNPGQPPGQPVPNEGTPVTGKTVQPVKITGVKDFDEIPEHTVLKQRKLPSGLFEYEVLMPDGSTKWVSQEDGYYETNQFSSKGDKVLMNSPEHFTQLFQYNLSKEKEAIDSIIDSMIEYGYSKEEISLDEIFKTYPRAFPAHQNAQAINEILQLPNYNDYISFVAKPVKLSQAQKDNRVVEFINPNIRGTRKEGVHINLKITHPITKKEYSLSHAYNPEFYEQKDENGNWKTVDFSTMKLDEFKKNFGFMHTEEVTEKDFSEFKRYWVALRDFNTKAAQWVEKYGPGELPKNTFSIIPTGELDFTTDDVKISDVPALKNSMIVYSTNDQRELTGKDIPGNIPVLPTLESGANSYYAYYKLPNGKTGWIIVYPKTIKLDSKEAADTVQKINAARKTISDFDPNKTLADYKSEIRQILEDIGLWIKPTANNKLSVPLSVIKDNTTGKFKLVIIPTLNLGNTNNPRRYVRLEEDFDSPKAFAAFVSSKSVPFNGQEIPIDTIELRKNIPVNPNDGAKVYNALNSSVNPGIIKNWKPKFTFHPENFLFDAPVQPVQKEESDIEKRREELTTFSKNRKFIKGVNHEVQIQKKFGHEGFDVDVSNKTDNSTGFLYSNVLSEHFDTLEEAIEYANQIIQGDKEYIKKVNTELAALETKPKESTPIINIPDNTGLSEDQIKALKEGSEQGSNDTDGILLKVSQTASNEPVSSTEALSWMKSNLPSDVQLKTIEDLNSNMQNNGITLGAVLNGSIYLAKEASKSDLYHEGYHIVFGNILSPIQRRIYLNKKKRELNLTQKELDKKVLEMKATSSIYEDMSPADLEDRYLEEVMADEYANYESKPKSIFTKLYDMIKAFVRFITNNQDSLEGLYSKISSGKFKNSALNSRQEQVYKLIPGLSQSTAKTVINTIAGKVMSKIVTEGKPTTARIIEAYNNFMADYDISLPSNIAFLKDKDIATIKRFGATATVLTKQQDDILREVNAFIERQGFDIQDSSLEEYNNDGNSERQFEKAPYEFDPADGIGTQIKQYLASTLYDDVDPFGRQVQIALPWREVYNRMLPMLSRDVTPASELLMQMEKMSAYSTQIKAVLDRIKNDTGWNPDDNTHDPKTDNFIQMLKQAFNVTKMRYIQVYYDENGVTNVRTLNETDLGDYKYQTWESRFLQLLNGYLANPVSKKEAQTALNKLVVQIENGRVTKSLAHDALNSVGINLSPKYLELCFSNSAKAIEDRKNFEAKGMYFITAADVQYFANALGDTKSKNLNKKSSFNLFGNFDNPNSSAGKIKLIANSDATFDEHLFLKTYTDANNKTRYSYIHNNLVTQRIQELKRDIKTQKDLDNFINQLPDYWRHNTLLNKDKATILKFISNLNIGLAGDIRDESSKKGVTMKNTDFYSYLLTMHGYYASQNKNQSNKEILSAPAPITEISDKNTQLVANLPIFNYFSDGKYTALADNDIFEMFAQEYKRVKGVYPDKFLAKDNWILFRVFNTPQFGAQEALALYKKDPIQGKYAILNVIKSAFNQEITDHIKVLTDNNLVGRINKAIIEEQGGLKNYVANMTINQTLTTVSLLQIIGGDMAWTKSWEDFVKRASGLIASGTDTGEGMHRVIYVKDTNTYKNTKTRDNISQDDYEKLPLDKRANYAKININDAQAWSTVQGYKRFLKGQGRLNPEIEALLDRLDNPIVNGRVEYPTNKELKDAGIDLIPTKEVVRGHNTKGQEVFHKMSVTYITKQLVADYDEKTKTWSAKKGKEELFNKMMLMDDPKVQADHMITKSGSKMFFPETALGEHDFKQPVTSDVSSHIFEIDNKFRRLQQENDSKDKGKIVQSNQEFNILGSEVQDPETRKLLDQHNDLMTKMRKQAFDMTYRMLVKNLPEDKKERADITLFLESLKHTVEESTPDSQLLEFLESENGQFKYDSNIPHLRSKFQSLFLATFKTIFRQQVPGVKYTAVSSDGFNIIYDVDTKRIITSDEYNQDPNKYKNNPTYASRPLKGMTYHTETDENGVSVRKVIPAEIVVPRKFAEIFNLKPGDEITEELLKIIPFRVPTQSYHSMAVGKIVDYLPEAYGDTIIAPAEFVWLMGMDFDIDALYSYRKASYINSEGNTVLYGSEKTPETKFEGYIKDLFSNNSWFKQQYKDVVSKNVDFQEVQEELKKLNSLKNFVKNNKNDVKALDIIIKRLEIAMAFYKQEKPDEVTMTFEEMSNEILFAKADASTKRTAYIQALKESGLDFNALSEAVQDAFVGISMGKEFNVNTTLKQLGLPSTPEELEASDYEPKNAIWNKIFDLKYEILSSAELEIPFNSPLSEDQIVPLVELAKKYQPGLTAYMANSPLSILLAYQDASQGKGLTGTMVNGNSFVQFAQENDLKLNEDFAVNIDDKNLTNFKTSPEKTRDKFDFSSGLLSLIVDNQKNPRAATLNLDFNTVIKTGILIGLGVDPETIVLFNIQPTIKEISKLSRKNRSLFKLAKKAEIDNYIATTIGKVETDALTNAELKKALELYKKNETASPEYQFIQAKVAALYKKLDVIEATVRNVNRIMSTNRHVGSDKKSFNKIKQAKADILADKNPVFSNSDVIFNHKVFGNNLEMTKNTSKALSLYDISETDLVQDLITDIDPKSWELEEVERNIVTALQMKALNHAYKGEIHTWDKYLLPGPESVASRLLDLKEKLPNNLFLKYIIAKLQADNEDKSNFDLVISDSRSKLSETTHDLLLSSFNELRKVDKEFAGDLYKYLIFKDNLQFKNNSFIKYVAPEMFLRMAELSSKINQALANNEFPEDVVGMTEEEFKEEFIENYYRHIINASKKAPIDILSYYGSSERMPYALTPEQNVLFEQKLKSILKSTNQNINDTSNIPTDFPSLEDYERDYSIESEEDYNAQLDSQFSIDLSTNSFVPSNLIEEMKTKFENNEDAKSILTSYLQSNLDALTKLLATRTIKLTNSQDTSKWGKEFPRLLMEVRSELSKSSDRYQAPVNLDDIFNTKPEAKAVQKTTPTSSNVVLNAREQWEKYGVKLIDKYGPGIKDIWYSKDNDWRNHKVNCL